MEKMENIISFKTSGKAWLKKVINFTKTRHGLVLVFILALASFMRLYKISEYMTFLGDEGRDAIVAKQILEGNLTFLGPRASAGDFFLGPIYYYMIAPFLALFNYDPVGPAVMVALFGVATVFLIYFVSSKFFSKEAGLIAASLYAISPIVIAFSRSSWNPNPVPFFTLLMLFVLYLGVKRNSLALSFLVGILLGIILQLHYIAVFLGVIIFVFTLISNILIVRKKIIKSLIFKYVVIFMGFILGISPFLFFELRHNFPNIKTIFRFIFIDNFQEVRIREVSHLEIVQDVLFRLYSRLTLNFPPPEQINLFDDVHIKSLQIITVVLIIGSIAALFFVKNRLAITLMLTWLFVGLFLFGFYKKDIHDYYYGFLFPVPFILIGNMLATLIQRKGKYRIAGMVLGIVGVVSLLLVLISNNPFQYPGNRQKDEAENTVNFIIDKTEGNPYNFALITSGNSDHVYRYFLEIKNRAPIVIENFQVDPSRNSVTEQLIVICDSKCEPVGHPLWEVAGFGRSEIMGEWEVPFVKIYKLVHVRAD